MIETNLNHELGMQSGVLVGASAAALPLQFKLMPEHLNDLGYRSVMVGKWHLGCSRYDQYHVLK